VDGLTGGEASSFIRRLASGLAVHWDKNYSNVLGCMGEGKVGVCFDEGYCVVFAWFTYPLEKFGFGGWCCYID